MRGAGESLAGSLFMIEAEGVSILRWSMRWIANCKIQSRAL